MLMRTNRLSDGTDPSSADPVDIESAPPDGGPAVWLSKPDSRDSGSSSGESDGSPGRSDGRSGPPPAWAPHSIGAPDETYGNPAPGAVGDRGEGGASRGDTSANPDGGASSERPLADANDDQLVAFLNGVRGLASDGGRGEAGFAGPVATLLSNGFNADAGVAQLVSALASLVDRDGAFNASPFAAPSDPSPHGVIAAALT